MSDQKFVLYVEDDHNYATLMQHVFKQTGFSHTLRIVPNGVEAIAYLKGEGRFADRSVYPFPMLLLLDLKMPLLSGFDVLEWVRQKSNYRTLPIVVLTCSGEYEDLRRAYDLGANSFLVKPPKVEDLINMMASLETYWLKHHAIRYDQS
jgi:CheY-like chemotaxis protein